MDPRTPATVAVARGTAAPQARRSRPGAHDRVVIASPVRTAWTTARVSRRVMRTSLIDPSDVARNTMLESRLTRRGIGPQVAMGIGRGRETSTTTGKGRMAGSVEVDRNRGPVDRSGSTSAALSVGEPLGLFDLGTRGPISGQVCGHPRIPRVAGKRKPANPLSRISAPERFFLCNSTQPPCVKRRGEDRSWTFRAPSLDAIVSA
jgi:hypothetical protein